MLSGVADQHISRVSHWEDSITVLLLWTKKKAHMAGVEGRSGSYLTIFFSEGAYYIVPVLQLAVMKLFITWIQTLKYLPSPLLHTD